MSEIVAQEPPLTKQVRTKQSWAPGVPTSVRGANRVGFAVIVIGVFGFGAWAGSAPIDGAVLSPGVFVATSQNKIIQHLEGGIIREIRVREGETVEAGQPLMMLDDTAPRSELVRLQQRHTQLQATQARLKAEIAESPAISFPQEIGRNLNPLEAQSILEAHRGIFEARRRKLTSEIAIQEQSIASFEQRILGDEARLKSLQAQFGLVEEELAGKTTLYDKGLVRKPEYLAAMRFKANMTGEIVRARSEVGDDRERIIGARKQIERLRHVAIQTAAEELNTTEAELKDTRERMTAAQGVLGRLSIEAPVRGTVVKLNYHTAGGVIRPGNDILAMLPHGDELIIEVRIRPQDIDNVKTGQEALVRLTALNQRLTPMISGAVAYVSADALPNERKLNEDNIYIARIRLDVNEARNVKGFNPTPGMPAEVYIKTGERTFIQYLLRPVLDSLARAFREN
jgi:HlyD family type I secretion membrane fusion protein